MARNLGAQCWHTAVIKIPRLPKSFISSLTPLYWGGMISNPSTPVWHIGHPGIRDGISAQPFSQQCVSKHSLKAQHSPRPYGCSVLGEVALFSCSRPRPPSPYYFFYYATSAISTATLVHAILGNPGAREPGDAHQHSPFAFPPVHFQNFGRLCMPII